MSFRSLDMEQYGRRGQFDLFRATAYPYAGMTVNLDLTALMAALRENRLPLYLTLLYAAANTANAIPEFRRRIRGDGIIEYDHCIPSYTLALEDGTYCYCGADDRLPFPAYLEDARRRQEDARRSGNLDDGEDTDRLFFFSTVPWASYTAIVQPVPIPADSNPRITWGKYFESEGRIKLPVSVLVHHALMDGYHISLFFSGLQARYDSRDWLGTI